MYCFLQGKSNLSTCYGLGSITKHKPSLCQANGYRYAGLEYYGKCFCGSNLPAAAPESECRSPCTGNKTQICGADRRISIYGDTTYPNVDLTTIVSDYQSLGCYYEG